ncbi:rab11 family-interacting protein 3 isoform X2 [Pygocentrus nattereri]|uniref:Rab11 family-interacting protein 3 n=1 Tax=Pygocentrus nattereri TaxID=42514 RepID=A0A3B4DUF4_PYGNA|nr:rab11 family-interacting protein 3 isoform X2 [Pygocentrus nattereri]
MEQVLSSPRGHSDWESDQNSLGFLLLDMDSDVVTGSPKNAERHQRGEPGIVSLSFDEIFQENGFNLDELFRASRYSGLEQTYSWERSSECVSPEWDKQPPHPQELAVEGCCDASGDVDTGDLISFSSSAPSPTHISTSMQATRQGSPMQDMDLLQPISVADPGCPLDLFIGQLPLEPLLNKTLSQSIPLPRTTVVENNLGSPSQMSGQDQDLPQSIPEQVGDPLCVDFTDVLDLAEAFSVMEGSGRTTSWKSELSPLCLAPLPLVCPSSSLPSCFYPDPPDRPASPTLCLGSHVQQCNGSRALPLVADAEHAGMSPEQESDTSSAIDIITDSTLEIQAEAHTPVDLLESDAQSVNERSTSDLVTLLESMSPGPTAYSLIEESSPDLCAKSPCEKDETLEMEEEVQKKDILPDAVPKDTPVHDLESVLTLAVLLASPEPERAGPVESTSTSWDLIPENSRVTEDLCVNMHMPETETLETPCHLDVDSDLSILCDTIPSTPPADDIQNSEPFASEKETHLDSSDASEIQSHSDCSSALETRTLSISCVFHSALDISPEAIMELTPVTESISPDSETQPNNSHSNMDNFLEDTEDKQTINTCSEDLICEVPQSLYAVDTHPLTPFLHAQEAIAQLSQSDNTLVNSKPQHCCHDQGSSAMDSNQVLKIQQASEDLSISDNNCEHTYMQEATPEEFVFQTELNETGCVQSLTAENHMFDNDNQNILTLTASSGENSVDTCMVNSTVLMENLPSDSALPAPGSLKCEVMCVQEEEREDRDNDQDQVTHSSESVPSLDSMPLSGADCQLTQVGVVVEQERRGATLDSADVSAERETDLPVQCTQVDLPQVSYTLPNPSQIAESQVESLLLLRDESPSGVCPPEETCMALMEENIDVPDIPSHAEMALDLCVSSDAPQDGSVADSAVPTAAPQDEDHSALRAVFQALDQDGDGFVRIEEFMEFATAYGAEQVKDLTRFLDPSGLGVISFEDFHRGITAISNGGSDPDLYRLQLSSADANGAAEEYDEQAEVSDSAYLGSESAYSECETFTDEDTGALVHPELHEDVETDSGIENTLTEAEDRNRFSLGSDLHGHALVAVIGGEEEHFEDFGESNSTSDLLLANQEEGRAAPEGEGDPETHPHPGSPMHRPPMLLSPSSSKRLSSKKAARHLLQPSGLDGMSDLSRDILDLADSDITDKVLLLERRVCELEKDSVASEEQHARLRQENLTLVHRANALEEQLKEQELHAEENLQTLARRHRDTLNKLQRERDLEIENLQARLHQLDEENSELRSCVPCLRANIERLEEEKRKLQDEVEDVTDRLNEETESRRKMSDKLSHERHSNQKEKESTQELIEDLRKQLEHLQLFKLETEARRGRLPGAGLQEYNTHMRENELEQEIRRLKQDNRSLKEQNDELNGQIINLSIQGAKSLFTESLSESLASEINNVSRVELMEAIQKQEEINYRLQDYIDRIIVAIMESNPSILEVK